jgi:autotransporter-associated beta strand protein
VIADESGSGGAGAGALLIDGGGTVVLDAQNTFAGGITIDSGRLILGTSGAAGSGPVIREGTATVGFAFAVETSPTNTLAGFVVRDTIDVTDMTGTAATATLGSGGLLVIPHNTGTLDLTFAGLSQGQVFELTPDGASGTDITVACYARGTLILTDRGECPVEALRIGDRLVTAAGAVRPLRWIGRRSYGGAFIAGNRRVLPVRIAAGALADGVPKRDLFVSPEHALFLDGMLVPATPW